MCGYYCYDCYHYYYHDYHYYHYYHYYYDNNTTCNSTDNTSTIYSSIANDDYYTNDEVVPSLRSGVLKFCAAAGHGGPDQGRPIIVYYSIVTSYIIVVCS